MSAQRLRRLLLAGLSVSLVVTTAACSADGGSDGPSGDTSKVSAPKVSKATITSSIANGTRDVKVDQKLALTAAKGTFSTVTVTAGKEVLAGALSPDKATWTSTGPLLPGQTYQVQSTAVDSHGLSKPFTSSFATQTLSLDQQTYPSFSPIEGETVGVGMPVIIHFDVPVTDHASIEKHLQVVSAPAQPGSFNWISDTEVHWRPQNYWQPGTKVTVNANIASIPAGNGIYGQKNRQLHFEVGRSMVSKVNAQTHQMQVFRNGRLERTIPITTGKSGFITRSGVKVIMEKHATKRMNSETIGLDPNGPDGYDLDDVKYAMRLTNSGEFIHAAPWSVGSQGRANVSHGCTGMSTSNAYWLYSNSIRGDVVEYTGTSRQMTLTNGFGDWNQPFASYAAGSALR